MPNGSHHTMKSSWIPQIHARSRMRSHAYLKWKWILNKNWQPEFLFFNKKVYVVFLKTQLEKRFPVFKNNLLFKNKMLWTLRFCTSGSWWTWYSSCGFIFWPFLTTLWLFFLFTYCRYFFKIFFLLFWLFSVLLWQKCEFSCPSAFRTNFWIVNCSLTAHVQNLFVCCGIHYTNLAVLKGIWNDFLSSKYS